MIREVEEYLEKYHMIEENDTVVIGVSGGADSVCLLLQLAEYRRKKPFVPVVVHVNHQIRPDAEKDAEYVEKLCERLQVAFHLVLKDVQSIAKKENLSVEEAGRMARYEAFESVLKKYDETGRGKIAVAHNENDCAETMLFHLFRGTGIAGLSGILPVRGNIIRPLLCLERSRIEEYLQKQQIAWRIDSTNEENTYTRNKIRNVIFPYAEKEICQNAVSHAAMAATEAAEVRAYLEEVTKEAFHKTAVCKENEVRIDRNLFLEQPQLIQKQIILEGLSVLTPARKDIESVHVHDILKLFEKDVSKQVCLPYELTAVREYDAVVLQKGKKEKTEDFYRKVQIPGTVLLPDGRKAEFMLISDKKDRIIPEKTYTKWFDYDKIINYLVLRYRRTGDYLSINADNNHKTLKEYMIAEKVPRKDRDSMPLLADGSHILWVIGMRISQEYKVTESTKRILQVTIR
ncbi:MAG: tRNA lysidine(34) synthetase TilS [Lachnospiraceae bacterium]|nr:tRNA lysidine(34) synthetase TilS [Lachnospiraceae bacterium]